MTPTPAPRDERELFEAWYWSRYGEISATPMPVLFKRDRCFEYMAEEVYESWVIWQARAALAEAEMEEVRAAKTHFADSWLDEHKKLIRAERERDELRDEIERVKKFDMPAMRAAARKAAQNIPGDMIDHILFAAIAASRDAEGGGV